MENSILDKAKIIKLVIVAFLLGLLVLVVAVMPAEYGIDPLGAGKAFGFSKLHAAPQPKEEVADKPEVVKVAKVHKHGDGKAHKHGDGKAHKHEASKVKVYPTLRMEQAGSKPNVAIPKEYYNPAPNKQYAERDDEVVVSLAAGKGIEYKFDVLKYGKVKYEWSAGDQTVFFDFHGEVKEKNPVHPVFYESYTVAYSNSMIGTFTSPFEGKHGWYFKNIGKKDVTIKIRLKGEYKLRK